MRKKGFIGAIVLAVLIFGGIILALLCTSRVPRRLRRSGLQHERWCRR